MRWLCLLAAGVTLATAWNFMYRGEAVVGLLFLGISSLAAALWHGEAPERKGAVEAAATTAPLVTQLPKIT